MKTYQASPRLQPLTPADLARIRALAAEHSVGLEQRCSRYRRRAGIRRVAVAVCFLALLALGADTAYATPPAYTAIETCGQIDNACDTIGAMLNQL